jgi:D-alanine-D-alanine ligase
VEGGEGGGRCIHLRPALLEDMGLPFTGSGSSAMALSSNKLFAKAVLRAAGIPTPDWHALPGLGAPRAEATGRYIVKSVWEHASIGLGDDAAPQVDCAGELCALLRARAPRMGGECFAERYVEGREFNVALLDGPDGPQVLPVAEWSSPTLGRGARILGTPPNGRRTPPTVPRSALRLTPTTRPCSGLPTLPDCGGP